MRNLPFGSHSVEDLNVTVTRNVMFGQHIPAHYIVYGGYCASVLSQSPGKGHRLNRLSTVEATQVNSGSRLHLLPFDGSNHHVDYSAAHYVGGSCYYPGFRLVDIQYIKKIKLYNKSKP